MANNYDYYGPLSQFSEEEVAGLWEKFIREKDPVARDSLIEHYMTLVYQTAERMAKNLPSFIDVNDLISAGTMGLIDAINRFEPEREIKFSTYCSTRVSGSILDELRRLDWAPRLVRSRSNQLVRSREELETKLGRRPSDEELAEHMDLSREQFDSFVRETQVKNMVSLDRKWDEDDDHELGQIEMMADTRIPDPLSELARAELKEVAIRGLAEKEKQVLVMYYFEDMSLKEIGAVLELSESRVCQIHAQTLEFLRNKFKPHAPTASKA
jgi:RNA polymerase sigma factor for flagellar operon FliA